MTWERVWTVNEYYDGPIFGVADYRGIPHVYDREWDANSDEYGPHFRLAKIDPDLLALVLEDWEIWLRWQTAIIKKRVDIDTHPALPEERARHEAIRAEIGNRFDALKDGPIEAAGTFRGRDGNRQVCWRA